MFSEFSFSKIKLPVLAIIFISGMTSCEDPIIVGPDPEDPFAELNLPDELFNYADIEIPDYYINNSFPPGFPGQDAAMDHDNTPANNQVTNAGATLGRVLFYDKKLSKNGTVSCSSCHRQADGFSDPNVLSEGFDGGFTARHSMALANARFYETGKFFWDERAATLEDQVLMPFQDDVEMGLNLDTLKEIISAQSYYPPLFEAAFGSSEIEIDLISKALAQFVRSMVSVGSKYDEGRMLVADPIAPFPNFTQEEIWVKLYSLIPATWFHHVFPAMLRKHLSGIFREIHLIQARLEVITGWMKSQLMIWGYTPQQEILWTSENLKPALCEILVLQHRICMMEGLQRWKK